MVNHSLAILDNVVKMKGHFFSLSLDICSVHKKKFFEKVINKKKLYVVLLVKWSAIWRSSLDELPNKVNIKVINVNIIRIAFGVIMVAASGASRFNQHLKKENKLCKVYVILSAILIT